MKLNRQLLSLIAIATPTLCCAFPAPFTPITHLPFTISAPGIYDLMTDLTAAPNTTAITVYQQTGYVFLNLNGHTIHMSGPASRGILVYLNGYQVGTTLVGYGTISGANIGVDTVDLSPNAPVKLQLQNMLFQHINGVTEDVHLARTDGIQLNNLSCNGKLGILIDIIFPLNINFTNATTTSN